MSASDPEDLGDQRTNSFGGPFSSPWDRVVTEPFRAGHRDLQVGDVIEFIGQMPDRRGEVLIGIGDFAVWASANDVAAKSKGQGTYSPSFTVTLK